MAAIPPQSDVDMFKEFASCYDNATAIKFIQGALGDVEAAMGNYLDNPDPSRYDKPVQGPYDESAFAQDRYGGSDSNIPSFQIHTMEGDAYNNFPQSTAPTRPNSRNSNSSMRVLTDHQENGVIGGVTFGPATGDVYDPSSWAMTAMESTVEIFPDLETWELERRTGEPVIIKPQNSKNLLPALLSILGRIPIARRTVLEGPPKLSDYGSGIHWWSGTPISTASMNNVSGNESFSDENELLAETQRLFVFMDWSKRLYGSCEPLESMKIMNDVYSTQDSVTVTTSAERFLRAWTMAMERQESPDAKLGANIFRSCVMLHGKETWFEQLDVSAQYSERSSIYAAVDQLIWESDPVGASVENSFLTTVAPVLILRLINSDVNAWQLNVDIPEVWYLDRYMAENKDKVQQMRRDRAECIKHMNDIDSTLADLRNFKPSSGSHTHVGSSLIKGSINYLTEDMEAVDMPEDDELDILGDDTLLRSKELVARMETFFEQIRTKVESLEQDKRALASKLEDLSQSFRPKSLSAEDTADFKYRYTLRGVCTKPSVVYLPMPGENGEDIWWKTEYLPSPRLERRILSLNDVKEVASLESREVMLVYASDAACADPPNDAPTALMNFVEKDNVLFEDNINLARDNHNAWDNTRSIYAADPPAYDYQEMDTEYPDANAATDDWTNADEERRLENHQPGLPAEQKSI